MSISTQNGVIPYCSLGAFITNICKGESQGNFKGDRRRHRRCQSPPSDTLRLTNAAEAVGKDEISIRHFFESNAFKALLGARPELSIFTVENAQKPIVGILSVKNLIWRSHCVSVGHSHLGSAQVLIGSCVQK